MTLHSTKVWAVFALILLTCTGCGMSKGQSVNLYLGSVTIHERRLQDDADRLEAIMAKPGDNRQALQSELKKISLEIKDAREQLNENKNIPEGCEVLHDLYKQSFDTAQKRVDATALLLSDNIDPQTRENTLKSMQDLQRKNQDLDEQIRQKKIELNNTYPEVQLPEAQSPQTDTQESQVH